MAKVLTVKLDDKTIKKIDQKAKEAGRTRASFVRFFLTKLVEQCSTAAE